MIMLLIFATNKDVKSFIPLMSQEGTFIRKSELMTSISILTSLF